MTKLQAAIIGTLVVAGLATTMVVQHQAKLREENQSLRQQLAQLKADNEGLSSQLAQPKVAPPPRVEVPAATNSVVVNPAPLTIFDQDGAESAPNLLIVRIQPEEGISLKFLSKRPGAGMTLRPVSMDFNYGSSFGERSPSAYETLLLDAIVGDATLYTRQDMVEASWSVVEPIQNVWRETKFDFPNYAAGTWGPVAADEMLARRGHAWRKP